MVKLKKWVILLGLFSFIIGLISCGAKKLDTPVLNISIHLKQIQFKWDEIDGATFYRLFENPDGKSGFTPIQDNIVNTEFNMDIGAHLIEWNTIRFIIEACNDNTCTQSAELSPNKEAALNSIGYIKSSNAESKDYFGRSVALSADGQTLAIGAIYEDSASKTINGEQTKDCVVVLNNCARDAGAVYLFERNESGDWKQTTYVKASNTDAADLFGMSVALSGDGNTLAVGAPGEDSGSTDQQDNNSKSSGAVYIFSKSDSSNWTQQAYLKAPNIDAGDAFGNTVALSQDGNTLAIGADRESGASRVVNGDMLDNNALNAGAVYLFQRNDSGIWEHSTYVKAFNSDPNDHFGWSLSLSSDGDTLAVGAINEESNSRSINGDQQNNDVTGAGAVYVFHRASDIWSQVAYVKPFNSSRNGSFGSTVSINADGSTLAVGAKGESNSTTGINSDVTNTDAEYSGAVYVFKKDSEDSWTQQSYIKASNAELYDQFGNAVALSNDGNTLVVSASREANSAIGFPEDQTDNSAPSSGAVYAFVRDSSDVWKQRSYIKATNTDSIDEFGIAIALSGDSKVLAVGAQYEDGPAISEENSQCAIQFNCIEDTGAVYLY